MGILLAIKFKIIVVFIIVAASVFYYTKFAAAKKGGGECAEHIREGAIYPMEHEHM